VLSGCGSPWCCPSATARCDTPHALTAVRAFAAACGAKFPNAAAKIADDLGELRTFFDYPAGHRVHLRTTNPIESTLATVRHQTKVTRGAGSRVAGVAMAIKLIESAQARWRAVNAPAWSRASEPALVSNSASSSYGPTVTRRRPLPIGILEAMEVPATSRRRIKIVEYKPAWPVVFGELGRTLRAALGAVALRIDHIGSTAVAGLAAKPIIDVQISVAAFEPIEAFKDPLERLGFVYRADNPERTKRYFREVPGSRRTHLHVRRAGSFSQQIPLLLRDYLRSHAYAAAEFATVKRRLARQFPCDGAGYTDAKAPYVWEIIRRADEWAQLQGWEPGPSDA
jgi:GrpB-like predicted nucleotidyltransferase (UPF0157 family)